MASFIPKIEGKLNFTLLPSDFAARIAARVESGLLVPGNRSRANYAVQSLDENEVTFRAEDLWTAINIGLNRVSVWRSGESELAWRISYWRWTGYVAGLGGAIGVALLACFAFLPQMRGQIGAEPAAMAIFWGNLAFWCLLWPWILTAIHGRVLRRVFNRVLRETLA